MYKLFYILYKHYNIKSNGSSGGGALGTFGILLLTFFCLFLSFEVLIGIVVEPYSRKMFFNKDLTMTIFCGLSISIYLLFFHSKKHLRLYTKFKEDAFLNSRQAALLGWITVVFLILSPFILILIKNKVFFGNWV